MTHYYIKQFGAKGTFVNIISFGAFVVIPGGSSYATSKLATAKFGEFLDMNCKINPPDIVSESANDQTRGR